MNRRHFLKQSGMGLASLAIAPSIIGCVNDAVSQDPISNIGLQVFSIRDILEKDTKTTLEHVSKIGYRHIETFGADFNKQTFWGTPVSELKKIMADNKLVSHSGHYDLTNYLKNGESAISDVEKYIEMAVELGQEYVVAPVIPMDNLNKIGSSDYQRYAELLNKAGEISKKSGIKIGYHNHFWEFKEFGNGTKGLDVMIAFTEPDLVDFELDLFWVIKAGENPQSYFERYPNRFTMWHVKDMDRQFSTPVDLNTVDPTTGKRDTMDFMKIIKEIKYTEVGTGSVDFQNIIRFSDKSNLKYAFVEQDEIYGADKIASIKKSYDYIQKHLAKR